MNIKCLACGGKGWLERRDWRGLPFPMKCAACNGTGTQRIAS